MNSKRVRVWLFRIGLLVSAISAGIIVRRYDFMRLPNEVKSLEGIARPGAMLIMRTIAADDEVRFGEIVEAAVDFGESAPAEMRGREFHVISRVAGLPKDALEFRPTSGAKDELVIRGERTWATMDRRWLDQVEPERRLVEGAIPEGMIVLIDPAVSLEGQDSRRIGYVPRKNLRRRLVLAF